MVSLSLFVLSCLLSSYDSLVSDQCSGNMISLIRKTRKRRAAASAPGSKISEKPPCEHQTQGSRDADITESHELGQRSDSVREIVQDRSSPVEVGKCAVCKNGKKAARKYRWKIILGLLLPFTLQALDITIIASALPWIAVDFGEIAQLNWIISAFNLTSAAFIPFWGQMAEIFGRHYSLQACVVIMLIGGALCTGAPTYAFPVLLLGRGIQGMGCAGISVIVRIVLADKVSLKENAKNWSIFSFTAGMSYGVGPVIGGESSDCYDFRGRY